MYLGRGYLHSGCAYKQCCKAYLHSGSAYKQCGNAYSHSSSCCAYKQCCNAYLHSGCAYKQCGNAYSHENLSWLGLGLPNPNPVQNHPNFQMSVQRSGCQVPIFSYFSALFLFMHQNSYFFLFLCNNPKIF